MSTKTLLAVLVALGVAVILVLLLGKPVSG
jgi:hypothetical protein